MRGIARLVLVWTIAVALVGSAAAWRQCPELQAAAAAVARGPSHVHATDIGAHDHHAMHHEHPATGAPAAHHDCIKCCAMCMVAGALAPSASETIVLTVLSILFGAGDQDWSGNTVAVDPGIPKRIA
jgi:hypothetical protein